MTQPVFEPAWIRRACAGVWVARPPTGEPQPVHGINTDTRSLREGEAFVALEGPRFDGHEFLDEAIERGASMLLVRDEDAAPKRVPDHVCVVRVGDTGGALLRLAAAHRRTLHSTRVVGVAGSNGKTTSVRLIDSVLSSVWRGTSSPRSFNNAVGVPLTILKARPTDQYLICEIGTSSPGEVGMLARVVAPDAGVITSIAEEHLEGLGSVEGVAREQASLLNHLSDRGFGVIPSGAHALDAVLPPMENLVRVGVEPNADLRVDRVSHVVHEDGPWIRFRCNKRAEYEAPLIGRHNAGNALMAIAVARRFNIDDDSIRKGLACTQPAEHRLGLERLVGEGGQGVTLIDDCYNANPASMDAAIDTLVDLGSGASRRVAVLADMLELGSSAGEAHRRLGQRLASTPEVDLVVLVGAMVLETERELAKREGPPSRMLLADAPASALLDVIRPGDAVLFKGSRSMRLERFVDALRERFGAAASAGGPACST